jgi:hypothetical protein
VVFFVNIGQFMSAKAAKYNFPKSAYLCFLFKFFKYRFLSGFRVNADMPMVSAVPAKIKSVNMIRKFRQAAGKSVAALIVDPL